MKGIILIGGSGQRLYPLSKVIGKALVPVYNKPMIYHVLDLFHRLSISEVLIVIEREFLDITKKQIGNFYESFISIHYEPIDRSPGMAATLAKAEDFAAGETVAVSTCDTFLEELPDISNFKEGARFFFKENLRAKEHTVGELSPEGKLIDLEEKPANPKSNWTLIGFYLYDSKIFKYIRDLKISPRGELELLEANKKYIKEGKAEARIIKGIWIDTGTFENIFKASEFIKNR